MSKKNKKHRRKEETFSEGYLEDWDDTYACIVGYTSGGAAYGLKWEQMEEINKREAHERGEKYVSPDEDDMDLPFS